MGKNIVSLNLTKLQYQKLAILMESNGLTSEETMIGLLEEAAINKIVNRPTENNGKSFVAIHFPDGEYYDDPWVSEELLTREYAVKAAEEDAEEQVEDNDLDADEQLKYSIAQIIGEVTITVERKCNTEITLY